MSDQQPSAHIDLPCCAVVLTFDRLPLRLLGTYGSSLCQTPHLDRLAAQSCVFDSHFAENLNESRTEHVWWSGHSSDPESTGTPLPGLAHQLGTNSVKTVLVTDGPPAGWGLAPAGFETIRVIEPMEVEETASFSSLLSAAEEQLQLLETTARPWLLWIHSSEMTEIPVPAMEFLELYLDELTQLPPETDEDDPLERPLPEELKSEALEFISETLELLERDDAELQLRHLKVLNVLASARVSELDHELGKFLSRLESSAHVRQTLLILTSDLGLSLGESVLTRQLTPTMTNCPLSEERVHVPLIVKTNELPFNQRCAALTQHSDVSATLRDWFDPGPAHASLLPLIAGEQESIRDFSVSLADDWSAIRDLEWLMLENRPEGIERLYHQPEDRHQVLDVLSQYIDVAERLEQQLRNSEPVR